MRTRLIVGTFVAAGSFLFTAGENLKESILGHLGLVAVAEHASAEDAGHSAQNSPDSNGESHENAEHASGEHHPQHKIVVTSPVLKDVTVPEEYVCQIHSRRHIEVRGLVGGYLKEVNVNEGQSIKQGDLMFRILPTIYQAKLDADQAEARLAQVEYENTKRLVEQNIVSIQELKLAEAKLSKAGAGVQLAQAELGFADIRAPFDGILDRLHEQQGSLIEEGTMLTTLSDNSVMWVYFNVPEARYLEYQAALQANPSQSDLNIELRLANHTIFPQPGRIGAIEADFNNETGNIPFRADFANPDGLLRHGQTGKILIHHVSPNAMVIPQRATFEILAKKYVYVVDDQGIVHQREIAIQDEQEDVFIIEKGLQVDEKIVLEGIRQVRDGEHVDAEFQPPEEVLTHLKYPAQ